MEVPASDDDDALRSPAHLPHSHLRAHRRGLGLILHFLEQDWRVAFNLVIHRTSVLPDSSFKRKSVVRRRPASHRRLSESTAAVSREPTTNSFGLPLPDRLCTVREPSAGTDAISWTILWDIENVPVPIEYNGAQVMRALTETVRNLRCSRNPSQPVLDFVRRTSVFANILRLRTVLRNELQSNGAVLYHIETGRGRKDTADKALITELCLVARELTPPAGIVLISGDQDFAYPLACIRSLGFTTAVIAPRRISCSPLLMSVPEFVLSFRKDMLGDIDPVAPYRATHNKPVSPNPKRAPLQHLANGNAISTPAAATTTDMSDAPCAQTDVAVPSHSAQPPTAMRIKSLLELAGSLGLRQRGMSTDPSMLGRLADAASSTRESCMVVRRQIPVVFARSVATVVLVCTSCFLVLRCFVSLIALAKSLPQNDIARTLVRKMLDISRPHSIVAFFILSPLHLLSIWYLTQSFKQGGGNSDGENSIRRWRRKTTPDQQQQQRQQSPPAQNNEARRRYRKGRRKATAVINPPHL